MPVNAQRREWRRQAAGWLLAGLALLVLAAGAEAAPKVGEVSRVQGAVTAQQKDESPRFVAQGDALQQGDVLVTSNRGYAVIGLQDGTQMTLRPSTTFAIDEFVQESGQESALFRLMRGGLRSVTGSLSHKPDAVKIQSRSATLAVREASSFDVRLCEADCAEDAEVKHGALAEARTGSPIVGRIAQLVGTVTASGRDGKSRTLARGAPLYSEDTIQSAAASHAVLAFRDQSRMTLTPNSTMALENVRFEGADAADGNFSARLIKGTMRAFTGLLGKRKPDAVKFNAATATIGIRGTGMDIALGEHCFTPQECFDAAYTHVWDGAIGMEADGKSLLVELDRTGVYVPARRLLLLLETTPQVIEEGGKFPRPDRVEIDFENLFGVYAIELFEPGLYVSVRDGHVEFIGPRGSIDLGAGESGYLKFEDGLPIRLSSTPQFLLNDPYPLPDAGADVLNILGTFNPGASPGDTVCEIR